MDIGRKQCIFLLENRGERPTSRELQILRYVRDEFKNAEVANVTGISMKTVEAHLSHGFQKIGAKNRTEALIVVQRRGWLDDDSGKGP